MKWPTPEDLGQQLADLIIGALGGAVVAIAGGPLWAAVMTFAIIGACASR